MKIQPQWVVTPGKQQTTTYDYMKSAHFNICAVVGISC
jgi:hypothetical protein